MADKVQLDLLFQINDALKNLDGFKKAAESSASSLDAIFTGLSVAAGAVIAKFSIDKITAFFGATIHSAQESTHALTGLNVALKNSGDFSEDASKQFVHLAESLEQTTTVSDEAVLSAVALAKTFNVTNAQAEKLVKAAVDLSAATGVTLNDAVTNIGRTLDGTTGRFQEAVPALRNLTEAQLKAGAAIDVVAKRFEGAGAATAQTFGGQIAQTTNIIDNFFESVGKIITQNPVVVALIRAAGEAFRSLTDFITKNSAAISQFISDAIAGLLSGIPKIIAVIRGLVAGLEPIRNVFAGITFAAINVLKAFVGLELVQDIIGGIIKVFLLAGSTITKVAADIVKGLTQLLRFFIDLARGSDLIGSGFKKAGVNLDSISDSLKGFEDSTDQFSDAAQNNIFEVVDKVNGQTITDFVDNMEKGATAVKDFGDGVFDSLDSGLESIQNKAQTFSTKIGQVAKQQGQIAEDAAKNLQNGAKIVDNILSANVIKNIQSVIQVSFSGFVEAEKSAINQDKERLNIQRELNKIQLDFEEKTKSNLAERAQLQPEIDAKIANRRAELEQQLNEKVADDDAKRKEDFNKKIADSANKSLTTAISTALDAVAPGFGKALEPVITILTKGGDQLTAFITAFLTQIPTALKNILSNITPLLSSLIRNVGPLITATLLVAVNAVATILSNLGPLIQSGVQEAVNLLLGLADVLPEVITTLTAAVINLLLQLPLILTLVLDALLPKLPEIIVVLAAQMPTVAIALAAQMPLVGIALAVQAPAIATAIIGSLIRAVPGLVDAFRTAFINAASNIGNIFRDSIRSIFDGVRLVIENGRIALKGLAAGGTVPPGFQNDSFPAMLSSGETVVPRSTTLQLQDFLDSQGDKSETGDSKMDAKILMALEVIAGRIGMQPLVVNVGNREIVNVIRDSLDSGRVLA